MLDSKKLWTKLFNRKENCAHRGYLFYHGCSRKYESHCLRRWKDDGYKYYYPVCKEICNFFKRKR